MKTCCGCYELREGTITIALTLVLLCALKVAIGILALTDVLDYSPVVRYTYPHHTNHLPVLSLPPPDTRLPESHWWGLQVGDMLAAVMTLAFNLLLIRGVHTDSACMIQCWLVYHGVLFAFTTIMLVGFVFLFALEHLSLLVFLAVLLLGSLNYLEWYWFAVVCAYKRELELRLYYPYVAAAL